MVSILSRHHRRKSVETWSFRLLAVWSFFAGSPTKSVSVASMFMCTSSRSVRHTNSPASICLSISSRPCTILSLSLSLINPYILEYQQKVTFYISMCPTLQFLFIKIQKLYLFFFSLIKIFEPHTKKFPLRVP